MARQTTETPLTIGPDKAADWLGLAPSKVRQMLYSGEIPGIKMGKRWLIPVKALESWIDGQMNKAVNN